MKPQKQGSQWRVRATGAADALRRFLTDHPLELQGLERDGETIIAELSVDPLQHDMLLKLGLRVEVLFDERKIGDERQREVSQKRWAIDELPQGLGRLIPKGR